MGRLTFLAGCCRCALCRCHCGRLATVRPVEFVKGSVKACAVCAACKAWLALALIRHHRANSLKNGVSRTSVNKNSERMQLNANRVNRDMISSGTGAEVRIGANAGLRTEGQREATSAGIE